MVRKKIIWSQTAISELENILAFFIQRNQSETYSLWLYKEVEKRVNIISLFPAIGRKTDLQYVHILPFEKLWNHIQNNYINNIYYVCMGFQTKAKSKDR